MLYTYLKTSVKKLDALRKNINLSNKIQNHKYRILHIGNFGLKSKSSVV